MGKEADQFENKQKKSDDQRTKMNDDLNAEKQTKMKLKNLVKRQNSERFHVEVKLKTTKKVILR